MLHVQGSVGGFVVVMLSQAEVDEITVRFYFLD